MTRNQVRAASLGPLFLALLLLCACSPQRGWEALLVLDEISASDGSHPAKRGDEPTRQSVVYNHGGERYEADLYLAPVPAKAGLVLVHGVTDQGKNDPRIVAFARTLARARFAVLVPEVNALREFRVSATNVNDVSAAVHYLRTNTALASERRVGVGAFSYAVGPSLLAALSPDTASRIDFVVAVGGYHDMTRALTYFTTGYYREDDEWRFRQPRDYGKWVFVLSNLEHVGNERDRDLLRLIALRKIAHASADVSDLTPALGSEGRAVYAFLSNRDPEQAGTLMQHLPLGVRREIAALTLADKPLSTLHSDVLLIHGRDDDMIPYTESLALATALQPGRSEVFIVDGLMHVDVDPTWVDRYTLWRAVVAVLAQRDKPAGAR